MLPTKGFMITLFLDFDGVLHPEFCKPSEYFKCLPCLEAAVRCVPSCEIVISSTWRITHPLPTLLQAFSPDVRGRVVGITPGQVSSGELPESLLGYEREAECNAWLRTNQRAHLPWVAVDDRAWLFKPFNQNLYLVNGKTGLRDADVNHLVARMLSLI